MTTRTRLGVIALLACTTMFATAGPAAAFTDLTVGARALSAVDKENPRSDKLSFKFSKDPELLTIPVSPLCPAETKVRILTNTQVLPEQTLDCTAWAPAGSGFKYNEKDKLTGLRRKLQLKPGKLSVLLKGPPYSNVALAGPVDFIETRLQIGAVEYCARWESPPSQLKKNVPSKVVFKGPASACQTECGNTVTESGEECDDGNLVEGDGCDSNCTLTTCGNGIQTAGEDCDDGNIVSGDGCRFDCTIEECGDGILDAPDEQCDDGNTTDGDCCDASCQFDAGGTACADDGDVCTDDVCDGAGTCSHVANTSSCDDGDDCTAADTCFEGTCGGALVPPWINEFDYDDFFANLDDRDEFIEIAGPAGTDLSGFQIVNVEGGAPSCLTPPYEPTVAIGEANLLGTIPPGTVLLDDTGTGIGFAVVCFTNTSLNVVNLPACDVILLGPRIDSNLTNGNLLNAEEVLCPDGILLLDDQGAEVDAVSYEGIIPNAGTYGHFFQTFPYSAPRDEGWLAGVSIERTTSFLDRAQSAAEWSDPSESPACINQGLLNPPPECPTFTWTPGVQNPSQDLKCVSSPCGAFLDGVEGAAW